MCNCFIFRSLAIPPYCWIMSLCLYFLIHPLQSLSWAPFFKRRIWCPCITSFLSSQPPGGFIIITVPSWSVSLLVIFLTADAVLKLCLFNPKFLNPNTLATWCEERTHLKRSWCWEGLGAGGEGADRGWDGWMASLTQWTWVWVNSRVGDGQGGLECWGSWGHTKSRTRLSDWTALHWDIFVCCFVRWESLLLHAFLNLSFWL